MKRKAYKRGFEDELEEPKVLPIHPRLAIQMGLGTIRNIVDAIVELVTNSDDSYKHLEGKGVKIDGRIIVRVERIKGGKCRKLEVVDFAEGMDKEGLKEALEFASETSGFQKGKSVRGFFGRGLKEAILTLGRGEICTIKNDNLSKAILWRERNKPMYRPPKESHIATESERESLGILHGNGTSVTIQVKTEKIKCPALKTFLPQVTNHYALRDINAADNREIRLQFESPQEELKQFKKISYKTPNGKKIADRTLKLPRDGDKIQIRIFESEDELESPYNNPCARAGLLIKTEGSILDNQLFRYQSERAGRFFYGEVIWTNLAERLRKEEALLDLNRGGIEWQQEVCLSLQDEVEKMLAPFVEEKKRQLEETRPSVASSEKMNKLNRAMCSLLNKLAKEHLSELPPGPEPGEKIQDLTIKPAYANIEINKARPFSVYAPMGILARESGKFKVKVQSNNVPHILVLNPTVSLERHRKDPLLYYGYFRVVGKTDKKEATITCKLREHIATATVRVAPPKTRPTGPEKPRGGKGGYFREIKPDRDENPEQRVRYDEYTRTIWISVNFPGVKRYFKKNLDFKSLIEGSRSMYAELIGEAFCKFTARYDIDRGNIPTMSDSRDAVIEAFIKAMNNSQKKCLYLIHEAVLKHKSL